MFSLKVVTNGEFSKRLEARAEKWRGRKIAAHIHAPDELKWWYWNEHGVPARTIVPVESTRLAFPGEGGGTELRTSVDWPGIKPHHTVQNVMEDVRAATQVLVRHALDNEGADNPDLVEQAVVEATKEAKSLIVTQMAEDLPGTRRDNKTYPKQSGKLHGETAASVFDRLAGVKDDSE